MELQSHGSYYKELVRLNSEHVAQDTVCWLVTHQQTPSSQICNDLKIQTLGHYNIKFIHFSKNTQIFPWILL